MLPEPMDRQKVNLCATLMAIADIRPQHQLTRYDVECIRERRLPFATLLVPFSHIPEFEPTARVHRNAIKDLTDIEFNDRRPDIAELYNKWANGGSSSKLAQRLRKERPMSKTNTIPAARLALINRINELRKQKGMQPNDPHRVTQTNKELQVRIIKLEASIAADMKKKTTKLPPGVAEGAYKSKQDAPATKRTSPPASSKNAPRTSQASRSDAPARPREVPAGCFTLADHARSIGKDPRQMRQRARKVEKDLKKYMIDGAWMFHTKDKAHVLKIIGGK